MFAISHIHYCIHFFQHFQFLTDTHYRNIRNMATATGKSSMYHMWKRKTCSKCEGCSQIFCFNHLTDHRQELSQQLDEIEINRDIFRQTLNEQINNPKKHLLIKQIDKWEEDSIKKIQQTAKECRQILLQHTNEHINQIEINLNKLTDQIKRNSSRK